MKDNLKTLKDLRKWAYPTTLSRNAKPVSRRNPRTTPSHEIIIKFNDLKAEIVKWVKEDIQEHENMFRDVLKGRTIISPTMTLIKKWMRRLDITEEDLK